MLIMMMQRHGTTTPSWTTSFTATETGVQIILCDRVHSIFRWIFNWVCTLHFFFIRVIKYREDLKTESLTCWIASWRRREWTHWVIRTVTKVRHANGTFIIVRRGQWTRVGRVATCIASVSDSHTFSIDRMIFGFGWLVQTVYHFVCCRLCNVLTFTTGTENETLLLHSIYWIHIGMGTDLAYI